MVLQLHRGLTEIKTVLFTKEDIPSNSLTEINLDSEIENIFIEINLW